MIRKPELLNQSDILSGLNTILDELGIDYEEDNNCFFMRCPIHDGNKRTAVTIYKNSGYWSCFTGDCSSKYGHSLFGFIRGCLTAKNTGQHPIYNGTVLAGYTSDFIRSLINVGTVAQKEPDYLKGRSIKDKKGQISIDHIRKRLIIPSRYYLERGFSAEVLDRFHVGDCWTKGKPLCGRSVFPI